MVAKNKVVDLSDERLYINGVPVATQAEVDELIGGGITLPSTALKFTPRVGGSYKAIWGNCTGVLTCCMKGKSFDMLRDRTIVKFYFELTKGKINK